MRNVSEKNVEVIEIQILFSILFYFFKLALYGMWKKKYCAVGQGRDDNMA